jgi:putative ABC transport system permease protein
MGWLAQLWRRILYYCRRSSFDRDLEEEVRFHLEMKTEEKLSSGMAPEEAAAAARREFGNQILLQEVSREMWRFSLVETLGQDLLYGLRTMLKRPGFTLAAVLSLALGIGANTAVFSVINAILVRSLPYREPQSLILVWGNTLSEGNKRNQVSATDVADWRSQNSVFEDVATYQSYTPTMSGDGGEAERVPGMAVGDGYFKIMKAEPLMGRVFTPEENEDGKDFEIILSHGLWQRRFGADPNVVGKTVLLNSRPHLIIGVMPADFHSLPTTLIDAPAEFYRPVGENYDEEERSSRHLRSIARLKPGITLEQAQTEMNIIAARLEKDHPKDNSGYGVRLVPISEDTIGDLRPTLLMLFGAVILVLLIACVNVGNLLLARSTARQKEVAIRAALGAGRTRLVRQFLTESVLLALAGGGLGLLFALWGTGLIESIGSQVTPLLSGIRIDLAVLIFTLVVSTLAGVAFGLAPALHLSQPDLNEALKEGGRSSSGGGRSRLRSAMVVTEVAMALVLLICAGLLIKSVMRLRDVDTGFNTDKLLTMNVALPSAKYPEKPSWVAFYNHIIGRIESLPGVESAGATSVLPLSNNFDGRGLVVEDRPKPVGQEITVDLYVVTPGYLRTMQIPLLNGRALDDHDGEVSPMVALVSEAMAQQLWPGQDPLGKRVKFPGSEKRPQPWRTVVGVVKDVKQYGLDKKDRMQLYLPAAQFPVPQMTLVLRASSAPNGLIVPVKNEIRAVDKDQAVYGVATMEQLLSSSISLRGFSMILLLVFAGIALCLASVGIYGVMNYSVTQRIHEIGIRIALGAQSKDVLKMVVTQGMALALTGTVIGLAAAFFLTRLMSSLLFGVSATDPTIFILLPLLILIVALIACLVPALRAIRVDPIRALRYE